MLTNIPEKRVEDGLLFGCITTKLYFCKKEVTKRV